MKVKKSVITAAGLGTRFLPASKAFQKEMVPVMNKPQLQYVIEESIDSGITDIAVVVRRGVKTFERYLQDDNKLWRFLKENKKTHYMQSWIDLKHRADITIYEQKESDPYGNGTPFIIAQKFVGKEPFAAMWGDDIMVHTDKDHPPVLRQMIGYFEQYEPSAVMSAIEVPESEINRYGSFDYYSKEESEIPYHVRRLVEKPEPEKAPSLYANACRFILTYDVIEELQNKIKGKDNEIWLTDAVDRLIQQGETVMAPPWIGSTWVPVGDPLRWLKANIVVALNHPEYGEDVREMLKEIGGKR